MRTIAGGNRTMCSVASIAWPMIAALVERAANRSGSRMVAYEVVGRSIGESGSWVRKFIGRQPVRLDADTWEAIKLRYEHECQQWEHEADLLKARFFALGRGDNAMVAGTVEGVGVGTGGAIPRAPGIAAVVADPVPPVE